jgi:hypothetical protein
MELFYTFFQNPSTYKVRESGFAKKKEEKNPTDSTNTENYEDLSRRLSLGLFLSGLFLPPINVWLCPVRWISGNRLL